jgi:hypothetical protein
VGQVLKTRQGLRGDSYTIVRAFWDFDNIKAAVSLRQRIRL